MVPPLALILPNMTSPVSNNKGANNNNSHLDGVNNGVVALFGGDEGLGACDEVGGDVLCVMWTGTAGLGDHLLGTDEENIVFLRFVIYHAVQDKVRCLQEAALGCSYAIAMECSYAIAMECSHAIAMDWKNNTHGNYVVVA